MKKLEYILIGIIVVLLVTLLFYGNKKTSYLTHNLNRLISEKEQLVTSITKLDSIAVSEQNRLYNKISLDSVNYVKQINKVKSDYNKERIRIKELNLTEQAKLLEVNINDSVEILKINSDTVVALTECNIETVNQAYNDLDYSLSELRISKTSIIELNQSLTSAKTVIDLNRGEIKAFNELSVKDKQIITELNKSLSEVRKQKNRQIIKYTIVSACAGVVVGLIIR